MDEFLLNAGAGSVGAIAGIVIGSPLDVIKTQLQSGRAPPGSSAFSLFRATLAAPRTMFKGVGASAMSMAPNNFVMFGSYGSAIEALKLSRHSESWSHLQRVGFAGSVGGFLQSFVVSPFELVKVQQQTAVPGPDGRPPSALASVRLIVQQHGAAGLWRGATAHNLFFVLIYIARFVTVTCRSLGRSRARHSDIRRVITSPLTS